jgi:hypothetical protein
VRGGSSKSANDVDIGDLLLDALSLSSLSLLLGLLLIDDNVDDFLNTDRIFCSGELDI